MSKQGTSRSRGERNKGATPVVVPISNDIVPGKFTENDLNLLVEQENMDDYIFSLIEGILQDAENRINEKYLNSRIVPFTVDLAKVAMLKIIEWNFLNHDQGETDQLEHVWLEDTESNSCTIDSWAQGYFPKRQASFDFERISTGLTGLMNEENNKLEDSEEEIEESITKFSAECEIAIAYAAEEEILECIPETEIETENMSLQPSVKSTIQEKPVKPKISYKPYKGKLKYDDLNMLTETLEETEFRLEMEKFKKQAKSTSSLTNKSMTSKCEKIDYEKKVIQKMFGNVVKNFQQLKSSDILFQTNENLIAMMKVGNDQQVNQRVKVNHKTLDTGRNQASNKENSLKKKMSINGKTSLSIPIEEQFRTHLIQTDKHPLPASMLDSIDPMPGVTVQEGDRIKKSTHKKIDREKQVEKEFLCLRPIRNQYIRASYMIDDIIDVNKVSIKPIGSTTPIPPIQEGFKCE